MRVLIQRVKSASVTAGGTVLGGIGQGLLAFVGIAHSDDDSHVRWMCEKILRLRVFEDEAGKMNRSVVEIGGAILVVSQFTLYGDASKGNRPSFTGAAAPPVAEPLYDELVRYLRATSGVPVESGAFGAAMEVRLVNDGPVTILIEK
jgi:D-tyrosyl-tRNA(Tyr) deacylase